ARSREGARPAVHAPRGRCPRQNRGAPSGGRPRPSANCREAGGRLATNEGREPDNQKPRALPGAFEVCGLVTLRVLAAGVLAEHRVQGALDVVLGVPTGRDERVLPDRPEVGDPGGLVLHATSPSLTRHAEHTLLVQVM